MSNIKYFEDFNIGDKEQFGSYDVTMEDIIDYASTWDPQPYHINEEMAAKSIFKGIVASGCHILAVSIKIIMERDIQVRLLAGFGWDEVRVLKPTRPGDTLSVVHECINTRESTSRSDSGVVKNRILVINQKKEAVLTYIDTILVAKREMAGHTLR